MINPQTDVKVISNSMTYYPIDSRNEEGLTIINSMHFLHENFGENVESFKAEDQIVVLQVWQSLLFTIAAKDTTSEELLRFYLQIMKDIAVFLFGTQFDSVMCSKSIVGALREIYARYIETFFNLCNSDYKFCLMIPQMDPTFSKLTQQVKDLMKNESNIVDDSFYEGLIFKNHKIISRFSKNENNTLELNDIFQLSLLEQVESSTAKQSTESFNVSIKGANVKIDGIMQTCILASGNLNDFYLIMIYKKQQGQNSQFTQEQKAKVDQLSASLSKLVLNFKDFTKPPLPFQITGMLHYILINRTTGEVFESQPYPGSKTQPEEKWVALLDNLKRNMSSIGMAACINGCSSVIRNEMIFQYTYDLIFVKKQKEILPKGSIPSVSFDKGGLSYKSLTMDAVSEENAVCYEMMAIYLGVMNTCDVVKANLHLFRVLTGIKRKNE